MIVALEGPDLCGKTTVFGRLARVLHGVILYPGLPMDPELLPHMAAVEARQEAVWRALYDPTKVYVCDRHFVVTSLVYSRLYGRPRPDYSRWMPELRVLYFEASLDLLFTRHKQRGDPIADPSTYARVLELYSEVLASFPCAVKLDAHLPVPDLVELCAQSICAWQKGM